MKPIANTEYEWYTPPHILELIYQIMPIDLDPASPAEPTVKADRHYTKKDNGLIRPWTGNIYLNPPYGKQIIPWIVKLCNEWENHRIRNAIILIPAKTDTKWFNHMIQHAACFCTIKGRLHFISPNNTQNQTGTFASLLVLFSNDKEIIENFTKTFSELGYVWQPKEQ